MAPRTTVSSRNLQVPFAYLSIHFLIQSFKMPGRFEVKNSHGHVGRRIVSASAPFVPERLHQTLDEIAAGIRPRLSDQQVSEASETLSQMSIDHSDSDNGEEVPGWTLKPQTPVSAFNSSLLGPSRRATAFAPPGPLHNSMGETIDGQPSQDSFTTINPPPRRRAQRTHTWRLSNIPEKDTPESAEGNKRDPLPTRSALQARSAITVSTDKAPVGPLAVTEGTQKSPYQTVAPAQTLISSTFPWELLTPNGLDLSPTFWSPWPRDGEFDQSVLGDAEEQVGVAALDNFDATNPVNSLLIQCQDTFTSDPIEEPGNFEGMMEGLGYDMPSMDLSWMGNRNESPSSIMVAKPSVISGPGQFVERPESIPAIKITPPSPTAVFSRRAPTIKTLRLIPAVKTPKLASADKAPGPAPGPASGPSRKRKVAAAQAAEDQKTAEPARKRPHKKGDLVALAPALISAPADASTKQLAGPAAPALQLFPQASVGAPETITTPSWRITRRCPRCKKSRTACHPSHAGAQYTGGA